MQVAFETLGCKLNQSESESLCNAFIAAGFELANKSEIFDSKNFNGIVVFNTCTVTSMAQQKARRLIRKVATNNSASAVIVTGCYAAVESENILAISDNIITTKIEQKSRLLKLPEFLLSSSLSSLSLKEKILKFLNSDLDIEDSFLFQRIDFLNSASTFNSLQEVSLFDAKTHSRAFLKIQDGCNCKCSYCRIPLARGKSVSLPSEEVLDRAKWFLDHGYKEIVLTGINICDYNDSKINFETLVKNLALLLTQYNARLRLSSIEPHRLTPQLLESLTLSAVTPHLHLALQSMCDKTLRSMNRPPLTEKTLRWISEYKKCVAKPFIASDFITGFDGETNEDFNESLSNIKEVGFAHLHVFPFSPREGTASFKQKSPVEERVRDERAKTLRKLSESCYANYLKLCDGEKFNVLVEGSSEGRAEESLEYMNNYSCMASELRYFAALEQKQKKLTHVEVLSENYLKGVLELDSEELKKIKRGKIYKATMKIKNQNKINFFIDKDSDIC